MNALLHITRRCPVCRGLSRPAHLVCMAMELVGWLTEKSRTRFANETHEGEL